LNYLGREERDAGTLAQASYGANYDRLVQVKAKYDPTNLFRLNHTFKRD
jgi:FAD/FMN-containing dehydrogenase